VAARAGKVGSCRLTETVGTAGLAVVRAITAQPLLVLALLVKATTEGLVRAEVTSPVLAAVLGLPVKTAELLLLKQATVATV
jgi:hypothetical protein